MRLAVQVHYLEGPHLPVSLSGLGLGLELRATPSCQPSQQVYCHVRFGLNLTLYLTALSLSFVRGRAIHENKALEPERCCHRIDGQLASTETKET